MKINQKLKNARINMNLTQEDVAEKIMISRQTISNWENGKSLPDIMSIINLSELYQISLDELLKGDLKLREKINKDVNNAKNNEKLILTTAIIIFVVMLIYTISKVIGGPFSDFCKEAMTWVLGGIALAFAMAYLNSKNK
jgi:transcriptional regulator with XRE-family HTH domain